VTIRIDLSARTPPYQQLRAAILAAIGTGELAPGDRLPTVRQLAGDLGVAPGTVQRAYAELEADGAVESRGRRGTFVRGAPTAAGAARGALEEAAQRFVAEAGRLGADPRSAIEAVAEALARRPAPDRRRSAPAVGRFPRLTGVPPRVP